MQPSLEQDSAIRTPNCNYYCLLTPAFITYYFIVTQFTPTILLKQSYKKGTLTKIPTV